jgi:signal peptidase I
MSAGTRSVAWLDIGAPGPRFQRRAAPARSLRRIAVHIGNLAGAAVLALAVCTAALVGYTLINGQHLETVVTGSMQPTIPIGSLVITDRVTASDVRSGDIIAFPEPCVTGKVIVHRVVSLATSSAGLIRVRTKGDANAYPDNWLANCADPGSTGPLVTRTTAAADRVAYVIPGVGTALDLARRFALVVLLITGGVSALAVGAREVHLYVRRERIAASDRP